MFFDYLGVRLNSQKAGDAHIRLNVDLGDEGKYFLELENGVLNNTADMQADDADATVKLSRATLNDIILQKVKFEDAASSGDMQVQGDKQKLSDLVSYLDSFDFWFNIVTP
jgi:alkyl sulfatase BDS1-like metallo-beta-lactamase superfamily hydrolase